MQHVLIVDAIFRGSRLFYSWLAATGAIKYGYQPVLITRTNSKTHNYFELFGMHNPELHEVVNLPENFWYGKVGYDGVKAIFTMLADCINKRDVALIYFSGINEIYPDVVELIRNDKPGFFNNIPVVFMDYDATFLLRGNACNYPQNIYRRMQWFLKKYIRDRKKLDSYRHMKKYIPKIRIAVLDERIRNGKLGRLHKNADDIFALLPDPPAPCRELTTCIETVKKDTQMKQIILVGRQSRRKGIDDVLEVARRKFPGNEYLHFVISGRLEPEMAHVEATLLDLEKKITWYDDYVSNEVLFQRLNRADYVMLPYTLDFNGSSGVMAMAASCGKPVITTDHGLVGYRTRTYKMGLTYKSGDIQSLIKTLGEAIDIDSSTYSELSKACRNYSKKHSIEEHQKSVFGLLNQF